MSGKNEDSPMMKLGRQWRQQIEDRQYEFIFGEKPKPVSYTEEEAKAIVAAIRAGAA